MAILSLAIGLLLAAQPTQPAPPPSRAFGASDSWWDCSYFPLPAGDGTAPLANLYRRFNLNGEGGTSDYRLWGPGLRVNARVIDTPRGARAEVAYLSMEFPATPFSRTGGAVLGDLLGDGRLIATTTIIGARESRRGYSVANAFFQGIAGHEIGPALAAADRWTLVVRQADGAELLRRDLPVPDRRARDAAFAGHWAALEAAWRARDPARLATPFGTILPRDRAYCLLSTPAARDEWASTERLIE